jgi:hypothetical protein
MSAAAARPGVTLSAGIPLGLFEVDLLLLARFGAGSGVLFLGTSVSLTISLLSDLFLDIFVEMLLQ